jgi:hypothetical protein
MSADSGFAAGCVGFGAGVGAGAGEDLNTPPIMIVLLLIQVWLNLPRG